MLETFGENGVDAFGRLADQGGVRGVRRGGAQCVAHHDDPLIDPADQDDQDREERGDRDHDHQPADDRAPPQVALRRRQRQNGRASHGQPPSRVRPRFRPATMTSAWSMVVFSSLSAAVLCTDSVSESLIVSACLPIDAASIRIGTTSATTTSTTTMVIVYPTTQPVLSMTS